MQGEELKAIRKGLGMTQAEFASTLGLSGTFIGLMERDEKPIEARTELAARYLAEGGPEPLRVGVAPFGDQYIVMVTTAGPGGRRNHRAYAPAFNGRDEAVAVAKAIAEREACPFIATID